MSEMPHPRHARRTALPRVAWIGLWLAGSMPMAAASQARAQEADPDAPRPSSEPQPLEPFRDEGSAAVELDDVERLLEEWTHPWLAGRDTPSVGLHYVLDRSAARLAAWGFVPFGERGATDVAPEDLRWGYRVSVAASDPAGCRLVVEGDGESGARPAELPAELSHGEHFVPLPGAAGSAAGELVFCGYGISAKGFDSLKGRRLEGAIALIVEGEPRHRRVLEGPELSAAANLYRKLDRLEHEGAVGALVVQRRPANEAGETLEVGPPEFDLEGGPEFRHTWASWNGERPEFNGPAPIPALAITPRLASQLLGTEVEELMLDVDKRGKPSKFEGLDAPARVELASVSKLSADADTYCNVAWLEGSDPDLADEYVVLGAHSDHVGIDARGRVALGADDNASGSVALLEIARALAAEPPRRSVLVCQFGGEEDGLLGSEAVAARLAPELERCVAMINLDMIGRGETKSAVALGTDQNPDMEDILDDACRAAPGKLKKVETGVARELFERSDHYSFHKRGVPVLFLFEQANIENNRDYHTWRDSLPGLNVDKVVAVAQVAEAAVRLLADADERLPAPR